MTLTMRNLEKLSVDEMRDFLASSRRVEATFRRPSATACWNACWKGSGIGAAAAATKGSCASF